MFQCHSTWLTQLSEECLKTDKQEPKVLKTFLKYSEHFCEKLLVNLIRNSDSINLAATLHVLAQGIHIKRRENSRLMQIFA